MRKGKNENSYMTDCKGGYRKPSGGVLELYRRRLPYISYTRLKEWKYTDKGWFCYELCVPEPPEVSEIMDGSFQYLGNEILNDGIMQIPDYQYRIKE